MPLQGDPNQPRLVRLARAQPCPDYDLAECWDLVIQGLEGNFFGVAQIERIALALELGSGIGFEEISFDAEGDEAVVSFIRDERRCPRDALITALRNLLHRFQLGPAYEQGEALGLQAAQGAAGNSPAQATLPEVVQRLLAMLTGAGVAPEAATMDLSHLPPELRARIEHVRDIVKRLGVAPETLDRDAAAAAMPVLSPEAQSLLQPLTERLSEVLKQEQARNPKALQHWPDVLSRWLQGESAAGAELDSLIKRLEATAGPLLQPRGRAAQNDQALHNRVRSSIRDALKKRGFSTD